MIRDAVLHFSGEQPLLCDLRELPAAGDAFIVVTNVRFVDGRKPGFIDRVESWFIYPLTAIRFIELPPDALGGGVAASREGEAPASTGEPFDAHADALLRRVREL